MIRLGLSSAAFLTESPARVLAIAKEIGFDAIEWAGDAHVPAGNGKLAMAILMDSLRAGVTVASYAPLYRAKAGGEWGLGFETILATAVALHAPNLRIFAGADPADRLLPPDREALVAELRRLGGLAAARGVTVALGLGRRTALEAHAAARSIVDEVGHPFVKLAWEQLPGAPDAEADAALDAAARGEIPGGYALLYARRSDLTGKAASLRAEAEAWRRRLNAFDAPPHEDALGRFVILGRTGAEDPERLRDDAAFLRDLIEDMEAGRSLIEAEAKAAAAAAAKAAYFAARGRHA
jgi:hypothetical protein